MANYFLTDAIVTKRLLTGYSVGTNTAVSATDSILVAFGKVQRQINEFIAGGGGTVTSVALSLPSIFSVTGSPVTTSGTLAATLVSQTQNTIFAAPSGSSGSPTFRLLVAGDIPNLDMAKITTGLLDWSRLTNIPSYVPSANVSGTINTLAKFTSSTAVGNSRLSDSGSVVTLTHGGGYDDTWESDYLKFNGISSSIVRGIKIDNNSTIAWFIESGGATYGVNTLTFRNTGGGSEKWQFVSVTAGTLFDMSGASGGSVRSYKNTISDGHLLVGTTSTSNVGAFGKLLEVSGSSSVKALITTSTVKTGLFAHNTTLFGTSSVAAGYIGTETNHDFYLVTNSGARGFITNDGSFLYGYLAKDNLDTLNDYLVSYYQGWGKQLRIGAEALVETGGNAEIVFTANNSGTHTEVGAVGFNTTTSSEYFFVDYFGTTKLSIDSNIRLEANVGILQSPSYALDITGTIRYTGRLINTPVTLSDGATITWNLANGTNATVTIDGNRTLSITNAVAGMYGTLKVIQGTLAPFTLTLPAGSKVVNNGAGAVSLSTTGAAIDILTFYYDGTNYFWTKGLLYTGQYEVT